MSRAVEGWKRKIPKGFVFAAKVPYTPHVRSTISLGLHLNPYTTDRYAAFAASKITRKDSGVTPRPRTCIATKPKALSVTYPSIFFGPSRPDLAGLLPLTACRVFALTTYVSCPPICSASTLHYLPWPCVLSCKTGFIPIFQQSGVVTSTSLRRNYPLGAQNQGVDLRSSILSHAGFNFVDYGVPPIFRVQDRPPSTLIFLIRSQNDFLWNITVVLLFQSRFP